MQKFANLSAHSAQQQQKHKIYLSVYSTNLEYITLYIFTEQSYAECEFHLHMCVSLIANNHVEVRIVCGSKRKCSKDQVAFKTFL